MPNKVNYNIFKICFQAFLPLLKRYYTCHIPRNFKSTVNPSITQKVFKIEHHTLIRDDIGILRADF